MPRSSCGPMQYFTHKFARIAHHLAPLAQEREKDLVKMQDSRLFSRSARFQRGEADAAADNGWNVLFTALAVSRLTRLDCITTLNSRCNSGSRPATYACVVPHRSPWDLTSHVATHRPGSRKDSSPRFLHINRANRSPGNSPARSNLIAYAGIYPHTNLPARSSQSVVSLFATPFRRKKKSTENYSPDVSPGV